MKVKYDEIVKYQDEFKERLPSDKAIEYIALSRELMHQAIDNENQLPDNNVYVTSNFSDDAIFYVFSKIYHKKISSIQKIGLNKNITFD